MKGKKAAEIGGFVAGAILILLGAVAIYMGVDGRSQVRDALKDEKIFFSTAEDQDPATDKYASEWYGEQVQTGEQARAFAKIIRTHQLERTGGLVYAEMGRYVAAANLDDPKGTSDEEAALKDEEGNPVSNAARTGWITPITLTTGLNTSFMAEQLSLFGMAVGVALLLAGVLIAVLTFAVFGREPATETSKAAVSPRPVTG